MRVFLRRCRGALGFGLTIRHLSLIRVAIWGAVGSALFPQQGRAVWAIYGMFRNVTGVVAPIAEVNNYLLPLS